MHDVRQSFASLTVAHQQAGSGKHCQHSAHRHSVRYACLLERVLADATFEAHFVIDASAGFHSLRRVHRLRTHVALLRLRRLQSDKPSSLQQKPHYFRPAYFKTRENQNENTS